MKAKDAIMCVTQCARFAYFLLVDARAAPQLVLSDLISAIDLMPEK